MSADGVEVQLLFADRFGVPVWHQNPEGKGDIKPGSRFRKYNAKHRSFVPTQGDWDRRGGLAISNFRKKTGVRGEP